MSAVEPALADYTVALSAVPWPGPWARKGRCRQTPAGIFFPGRGEDTEDAKAVCARCPVLAECRKYALAHPALHGVWGGLSVEERRHLRRHLTAVPPPQIPPAAQSAAGTRYRLLEELTAHPNQWARIAHYTSTRSATATASQLRSGRLPAPPGRWRFEGRVNEAGGSDLYAHWEGGAD